MLKTLIVHLTSYLIRLILNITFAPQRGRARILLSVLFVCLCLCAHNLKTIHVFSQIKVCYGDNCYHKNRVEGREDICILEVHKDRNMCAINSSFCKRKEGDECGWAHTSQWRACRRGGVKKVFVEP